MESVEPGIAEGKGARCGLLWSGLGCPEGKLRSRGHVYMRGSPSRACLEDQSVTLFVLFSVSTFLISHPSYSFPYTVYLVFTYHTTYFASRLF